MLLLVASPAWAGSGGRSTFRVAGECTIEGKGKAATLVVPLAYGNPGATRRDKKGNVARFFVHEQPPWTINTGHDPKRNPGLEVAEGKPIGEVVMSVEAGMCKLRGQLGDLGLKRGKRYYLGAYWPGILGGDGNGHRWGVSNNSCGGNGPVAFTVPGGAKKNSRIRGRWWIRRAGFSPAFSGRRGPAHRRLPSRAGAGRAARTSLR